MQPDSKSSDLTYYMRRGFFWATGRGASMLAVVAVGALGLTSSWVAFVPLVIGAAFTFVNNQLRHDYHERKILSEYGSEISAIIEKVDGRPPLYLTREHLYLVAEGSRARGIEGNATLREAVERNSSDWGNRLVSDMAAIAVTSLLLFAWPGALATLAAPAAGALAGAIPFISASEKLALGLAAAASHLLVYAGFREIGKRVHGLHKPSVYDRIQTMKWDLHQGREITPEKVFEIFIERDPSLTIEIARDYGAPYEKLPPLTKRRCVELYDAQHDIFALTKAINGRWMSPNELAFRAEDQESGVTLRPRPPEAAQESFLGRLAKSFRGEEPRAPATPSKVSTPASGVPVLADIENEAVPAGDAAAPRRPSFAERFESRRQAQAETFAEKVQAQPSTDPGLWNIH